MAWIPGITDAIVFFPANNRIALALEREYFLASQSKRHPQAGLYEEAGGNVLTAQRRLGSARRLPGPRTTRRGIESAPEV